MRKFIVTVIVLLFSIASQAEARMYDPRTGRFLSKDPFLTEVPDRIGMPIEPVSYSTSSECLTCDENYSDIISSVTRYASNNQWRPDKYGPVPISYARPPIAIDRYGNIGIPSSARITTIMEHPYVYVRNNPVNYTDPMGLRTTLAQHDVGGIGRHRYIVLQPDCPGDFTSYRYRFYRLSDGGWEATISGQPQYPPPTRRWGNLVSRPNSDRHEARGNETEIYIPENKSDTQFIKDLLRGESLYPNNLPYCLRPTATNDCYNSNSYARGILRYGGVPNPPDIGGYAPGWDKPIPLGN